MRNKHLAELAAVRRLSERWSVLVKGDLWFSDEKREDNHVKGSSTLGFALRPRSARKLTVLSLAQVALRAEQPRPSERDRQGDPRRRSRRITRSARRVGARGQARRAPGRNSFRGYSANASAFMYQAQVDTDHRGEVGRRAQGARRAPARDGHDELRRRPRARKARLGQALGRRGVRFRRARRSRRAGQRLRRGADSISA